MTEKVEIGFQSDFKFTVLAPGIHQFRIDEVELNESDSGWEGIVNLTVTSATDEGVTLTDRLPFHATRQFGYRKFMTLLCVTDVLNRTKKYSTNFLEKNMEKLGSKLEGKSFVGEIAIVESGDKKFANIVKYFSVLEAKKEGLFKSKKKKKTKVEEPDGIEEDEIAEEEDDELED
jgi:hypothetical protein